MQPFAPALDLPAHIAVEAHYRPKRHHATHGFPSLVLIRGVPGSGKSTLAGELTSLGYRHFEADDFFMVDGRYRYDASRIRQAHEWCRQQTLSALRSGHRVVVANTFTRLCELRPYAQMSDDVLVLWARGRWPNVHHVPAEVVDRMDARWEPLAASQATSTPDDTHSRASVPSPRLAHERFAATTHPSRIMSPGTAKKRSRLPAPYREPYVAARPLPRLPNG